jgi:hypothetical protein
LRRAEGGGLGPGEDRELGQQCLAEDHRARRAQPADDLGVLVRRLPERVGAMCRQLAGHVDVVLHGDRDAEQRPLSVAAAARVGLVGLGQRALGHHDAIGVQLRVDAVDALQVELHELTRGDVARADEFRLSRESGEGKIELVHARHPIGRLQGLSPWTGCPTASCACAPTTRRR